MGIYLPDSSSTNGKSIPQLLCSSNSLFPSPLTIYFLILFPICWLFLFCLLWRLLFFHLLLMLMFLKILGWPKSSFGLYLWNKTPRTTLNYEPCWLWCVTVGSSVLTNVPLWWGMLIVGEAMHVWVRGIWEISALSPQCCWDPKTAVKK